MALAVSVETLKRKCGLTGAEHDSALAAGLSELLPVLEASLEPAALADPALAATLNLGAAEWIAGEWLAQEERAIGLRELALGPIRLTFAFGSEALRSQGSARLAPFVRTDAGPVERRGVLAAPGRLEVHS